MSGALPNHIAIIMDGNGRWAKGQGRPRNAGHEQGVDSVKSTVAYCVKNHIHYLTLFAFGQDNNKRPQKEVDFLIALFVHQLFENIPDFCTRNIKIRVIGDFKKFNAEVIEAIQKAETATQNCTGLQLTFALNYAGRWDLTAATKKLCAQVQAGDLALEHITQELFMEAMPSAALPNVDLMIRTSGEARLSDFMLWQLAYAELYFTPISWPEFNEQAMADACAWFASRERRFGKISEQL